MKIEPAANYAITPGDLRAFYTRNRFSFGNPSASTVVCLIGSCRVVTLLNFLRAYNDLNNYPLELLCLNPVECWQGQGTSWADGVNERMAGYRFGKVDFLVCEHMVNCGYLNTTEESEQNIFVDLACRPEATIRLPNWHSMHLYDSETAGFDHEYAALDHAARVTLLRERSAEHKERFLGYCRESGIPELEAWVEGNWTTTRMGWTNNHMSLALAWKIFELVAAAMQLNITPALAAHPLCSTDMFKGHHTVLGPIDYEANGWKF